jgi:hypothetical protein
MSNQITGASLLAMRSLAAQATDSAITTQGNLDALARQYAELKSENLKLKQMVKDAARVAQDQRVEWHDARKILPPDPGEMPARYMVILDTRCTVRHYKTWAGMGEPEFADYYKGWSYPWNARGSLEVAYWAVPPEFNMQWKMNSEGTPGEWVPNANPTSTECQGKEQEKNGGCDAPRTENTARLL